MKNIKVVGGGIYGCHIACTLLAAGHDVTLFERRRRLLDGATGNNVARLHLGFHYPRSSATRWASQRGSARFMQAYPALSVPIATDVYAVADDSLIDFRTYLAALSGVPFKVMDPAEFGLVNCEGAVLTQERLVDVDAARVHFTGALAGCVEHRAGNLDEKDWDAVVDTTFGAFGGPGIEAFEACLMYILRPRAPELWDVALTVMDGPYFSIHKHYEPGMVSLTSAPHTPMRRFDDQAAAVEWLDQLPETAARAQFRLMGELATRFMPEFPDLYELVTVRKAVRARPFSMADGRELCVTAKGKVITVRPGKIDTVFAAADQVMEMLK